MNILTSCKKNFQCTGEPTCDYFWKRLGVKGIDGAIDPNPDFEDPGASSRGVQELDWKPNLNRLAGAPSSCLKDDRK
jgi:hypothetical protein